MARTYWLSCLLSQNVTQTKHMIFVFFVEFHSVARKTHSTEFTTRFAAETVERLCCIRWCVLLTVELDFGTHLAESSPKLSSRQSYLYFIAESAQPRRVTYILLFFASHRLLQIQVSIFSFVDDIYLCDLFRLHCISAVQLVLTCAFVIPASCVNK